MSGCLGKCHNIYLLCLAIFGLFIIGISIILIVVVVCGRCKKNEDSGDAEDTDVPQVQQVSQRGTNGTPWPVSTAEMTDAPRRHESLCEISWPAPSAHMSSQISAIENASNDLSPSYSSMFISTENYGSTTLSNEEEPPPTFEEVSRSTNHATVITISGLVSSQIDYSMPGRMEKRCSIFASCVFVIFIILFSPLLFILIPFCGICTSSEDSEDAEDTHVPQVPQRGANDTPLPVSTAEMTDAPRRDESLCEISWPAPSAHMSSQISAIGNTNNDLPPSYSSMFRSTENYRSITLSNEEESPPTFEEATRSTNHATVITISGLVSSQID